MTGWLWVLNSLKEHQISIQFFISNQNGYFRQVFLYNSYRRRICKIKWNNKYSCSSKEGIKQNASRLDRCIKSYLTKRTITIFDYKRLIKESSTLRYNASYCQVMCSEKEAKLPTIRDFATTKNVIEYFSSPEESILKRIEKVGNGFLV